MRALRLLAAISLVAASLAFAGPVAAGDPCYHGFDLPARSDGLGPQVKMMPCAFSPTVVRVAPGTTVEWLNGPDFTHLVTGANQEWGSRDAEVAPGRTVSYRFDRSGVYPYACALHRGMSGVVIVGDAVAAAAVAQPADAGAPTTRAVESQGGATTSLGLAAAVLAGVIVTGVLIVRFAASRRGAPEAQPGP